MPGWIDPKEYYTVTARMPLIKEGCVGSSVRLWQELIGVPVDGEFGPITHGATVGFQSNHDLVIDGEVGPKTWSAALSELT
jgi:peptidoglycan hydrolase-like protein with peptidoglycan-binding domain